MKNFGQQLKNGHVCEVRVIDPQTNNPTTVAIGDAITSLSVTDSSTEIAHCEVTVQSDKFLDLEEFALDALIEIWLGNKETGLVHVATLKIDYVEIEKLHDNSSNKCKFQARSTTSALMDNGCRLEHSGSLEDLVSKIASSQGVPCTTRLTPELNDIVAWIDADSAYGSLRLLGLCFDALVHDTRDGHLEFISRQVFLDETESKDHPIIENPLSFTGKMGKPIRTR